MVSPATKTYTVVKRRAANGRPIFTVVNNVTCRAAASMSSSESAERHARFLNEQDQPQERDADWMPGSTRNWWARNGGGAA